jgi:hypothetical protein
MDNHTRTSAVLNRGNSRGRVLGSRVVTSFVVGSITTACLMHLTKVRADNDRVFELDVYHAVPGKVRALESRFRDASKLLAKHDLRVVGYWVQDDDPAWGNKFVYIVAHRSREEAQKNWDAFHADPAFQEFVKSEQNTRLIETVDKTFMRPAEFSPMR